MTHKNTRRGFTQVIVGDNTLFTSPLEGEDVRRTEEGAWNKSFMAPPLPAFGHPLPQGARITTRGFTLIELLVVVLIIGILAAVAVPQYQVAVTKSRVGTMLSLVASLAAAQEVYYLAHGDYAPNLTSLDIDLPTECKPIADSDDKFFTCGKYFTFVFDTDGSINLNYCPNNNTTEITCENTRDLHIPFRLQHYKYTNERGLRKCYVKNSSKLGKAVCSTLAGFVCSGC